VIILFNGIIQPTKETMKINANYSPLILIRDVDIFSEYLPYPIPHIVGTQWSTCGHLKAGSP
jgi:hypothetical protein